MKSKGFGETTGPWDLSALYLKVRGSVGMPLGSVRFKPLGGTVVVLARRVAYHQAVQCVVKLWQNVSEGYGLLSPL